MSYSRLLQWTFMDSMGVELAIRNGVHEAYMKLAVEELYRDNLMEVALDTESGAKSALRRFKEGLTDKLANSWVRDDWDKDERVGDLLTDHMGAPLGWLDQRTYDQKPPVSKQTRHITPGCEECGWLRQKCLEGKKMLKFYFTSRKLVVVWCPYSSHLKLQALRSRYPSAEMEILTNQLVVLDYG
jgi:hypothetical protein